LTIVHCIDPLLLYQCTTDNGSSGSPVLKEVNGELKIVALHRGGRETGGDWLGYNCGTLIKEMLNHLSGKSAPPCKLLVSSGQTNLHARHLMITDYKHQL